MKHATLYPALVIVCALAAPISPVHAQADEAKPTEHVTGSGGRFLRYSSKQTSVDLTPAQQAVFAQARDHVYAAAELGAVLKAAEATLKEQAYATVDVDREYRLVEGRHDEVLIGQAREALRGVLKSKMNLPGRADHQSTEVLLAAMPSADGHGVSVRTRFRVTVWDSNGDSKTSIVSDPAVYATFYAGVGKRLAASARDVH